MMLLGHARKKAAALAAALIGALPAASPARATCGAGSCFLVTGTTEGVVPEGSVSVDLSLRFIPQSRRLRGRDGVSEVLTPRIDFENETIELDHHREINTQNTLAQMDLAYGISRRWTLFVTLPFINDRQHEHWDEVGMPSEFFTREDGGSGFGDVRLGARRAFLVRAKDLLVGSLAVKAPTGAYKLSDSEGEINEPSVQPGTGSWDWLASAYYQHEWVPRERGFFVSAAYRRNGENDLEYRFGDEAQAFFGVQARAGTKAVWIGQINARRACRDRYLGETVPSTGSTFVNFTPGLRLESGKDGALYLFVAVPVFQDVNEAQIAPRASVLLGVSRSF
jgi:hypothetical protein